MHHTIHSLFTCLIALVVPFDIGADPAESVLTVTVDDDPIRFDLAALTAFHSCFWNVNFYDCSAGIDDNGWVNSKVESARTIINPPVQLYNCAVFRKSSVNCSRLENSMATPCPGCDTYFSIKYNLSIENNCTKIIWSSYKTIRLEVIKKQYFCEYTTYNTSESTLDKSENTTIATNTRFSSTSPIQESNITMPFQGLTTALNTTISSTIESTKESVENSTQLTSDDEDSDKILIIILATVGGFLLLVIIAIILCIVCKSRKSRNKEKSHDSNETHTTSQDISIRYGAHGNTAGASNQNGLKCDNGIEMYQCNVYDEAFEDHTDQTGFVSTMPTTGSIFHSPINNPGSDKSLSTEEDSGYSSIGDIFPHLQNIQKEHQKEGRIQTDALVNSEDRETTNSGTQLSDVEYSEVDNGEAAYSRLGENTKNFTSPYSVLLNPNIDQKSRHPVPLPRKQTVSNDYPMVGNFPDYQNSSSLSNDLNVNTAEHVLPSEYAFAEEISGFDGAGMGNPFTHKEATRQPCVDTDLEPVYAVVKKTKRKFPEKENSQDSEGLKDDGNQNLGLEEQGAQFEDNDVPGNNDISEESGEDNDKPDSSEDNDRVYYELDRDNDFWINSGRVSGLVQNVESEI